MVTVETLWLRIVESLESNPPAGVAGYEIARIAGKFKDVLMPQLHPVADIINRKRALRGQKMRSDESKRGLQHLSWKSKAYMYEPIPTDERDVERHLSLLGALMLPLPLVNGDRFNNINFFTGDFSGMIKEYKENQGYDYRLVGPISKTDLIDATLFDPFFSASRISSLEFDYCFASEYAAHVHQKYESAKFVASASPIGVVKSSVYLCNYLRSKGYSSRIPKPFLDVLIEKFFFVSQRVFDFERFLFRSLRIMTQLDPKAKILGGGYSNDMSEILIHSEDENSFVVSVANALASDRMLSANDPSAYMKNAESEDSLISDSILLVGPIDLSSEYAKAKAKMQKGMDKLNSTMRSDWARFDIYGVGKDPLYANTATRFMETFEYGKTRYTVKYIDESRRKKTLSILGKVAKRWASMGIELRGWYEDGSGLHVWARDVVFGDYDFFTGHFEATDADISKYMIGRMPHDAVWDFVVTMETELK